MDYPGKVITKTQVTPTQTSASGNWTLDDQAAAIKNNNWPIAGVPNPISKSLRFNSADTAYLNRTPSVAGNLRKWTWSGWVKRSTLSGTRQGIFTCTDGAGSNYVGLEFIANETLVFNSNNGSAGEQFRLATNAVFRDPSAWYHIVVFFDTAQATASNRAAIYVNGVLQTYSTATYMPQNYNGRVNTTNQHSLGSWLPAAGLYLNGYMTEANFIDGQALTPSSFGMTDPITGVWEPIKYTGTYGTNGFYLNFKDATSTTTLGYDYSGNANNWTANGFVVTPPTSAGNDSVTDVPTPWVAYNATGDVGGVVRGNYCTINPLSGDTNATITNGNLTVSGGTNLGNSRFGTIGISSGKWYWEHTITTVGTNGQIAGISNDINQTTALTGIKGYYFNGNKYDGATASSYGATFTTGDVIGVALDMDAGTITFYKNNASQGQAFSGLSGTYFPLARVGTSGTAPVADFNFGQRPFAYTPPSGFRSLCTTNLEASTVLKGSEYMNAVLYSGNSGSQSITGVGFQPDLVWGKSRNIAENNALFDSVRGVNKALYSNLTNAEATDPGVSAFNSDGFSLNGPTINATGYTYVAWNWKANGAGVSNTAGTITSTVSANTTSGFSIIQWSGSGANATIGHGLGTTPAFIIVKDKSSGTNGGAVYHTSRGATKYLKLFQTTTGTDPEATDNTAWNGSSPTFNSTVFSVGSLARTNASGTSNMIAYAFAEVPGYSAFGSYTGNGATVGPFVYTGFRPRFVLTKGTATSNWAIIDTSISPYNVAPNLLIPNTNGAVLAFSSLDILSNGFQIRNTDSAFNANGNTYIYACFAENPFKNALAR